MLSAIAETQPKATLCGFVVGFKHTLTYTMHTSPDIEEHLKLIDDVISNEFILAFIGWLQCR